MRNEQKLAERIIIGLDGYDTGFSRACSEIFHIDLWLDGAESVKLRGWITASVHEVINMFSVGPGTMMVAINMGPDLSADPENREEYKMYPGLSSFSKETIDEFVIAYKAFAANMYSSLNKKLEPYILEAFEMGYSDIACSVFRYAPNLLILNVRAITPFPDKP